MAELLDQIKNSTTRISRWEKLCEELGNKQDIDDLKAALKDRDVQINAIVRVLRSRGIVINKSTISTWRNEGNYES
jgi:hypothetical protein